MLLQPTQELFTLIQYLNFCKSDSDKSFHLFQVLPTEFIQTLCFLFHVESSILPTWISVEERAFWHRVRYQYREWFKELKSLVSSVEKELRRLKEEFKDVEFSCDANSFEVVEAGHIYFFGGYDVEGNFLNDLWVLRVWKPQPDHWKSVPTTQTN